MSEHWMQKATNPGTDGRKFKNGTAWFLGNETMYIPFENQAKRKG
jgi:hypothetical protein